MTGNNIDIRHSGTLVMENSSPVRILIIDEDTVLGNSLAELLHANGYFAHLVCNADAAREIIPKDHFDMIICDANLPGISRSELISYGRKHHPLLEVIFTSRKPEFAEALQSSREGGFDYISKKRIFNVILDKVQKAHHCQLNHLVKNFSCSANTEICEHLNSSFPSYKVIRKIGQGATGIVMLAERETQYYALKLLCRELVDSKRGRELVNHFLAEAEVVSGITHPHVVKIYESGFLPDGGIPYILMEYLDGGSLQDYIAGNTFSYEQKIDIIAQLCDALDVVHQYGILHRDIKPANIMMQKTLCVKLSDFSIARTIDSIKNTTMEIIGSPAYMSPEAFLGSYHVDERSDIFSLGVVACELLTGLRPYPGSTISEIVQSQKHQRTGIVLKPFKKLPDDIQVILAKMLRINPAERYQSATEIIPDLAKISR